MNDLCLKQIKSSTQTTTTTQTIKTSTRTTTVFSWAPSLADVRVWLQSKFATDTTDTFRLKTDFSKVFKFNKSFLILMKTLNCDVVNSNLLCCCCTYNQNIFFFCKIMFLFSIRMLKKLMLLPLKSMNASKK